VDLPRDLNHEKRTQLIALASQPGDCQELPKRALEMMPTPSDVLDRTDAPHLMPAVIHRYNPVIGALETRLRQSPELYPHVATCYRSCGMRDSAVVNIRILCVAKLLRHSRERGDVFNESDFPEEVMRRARRLPQPRRR